MDTDLRQLHLKVAKGKANGQIIWQPRIGCWFDERRFANIPFPEKYHNMELPDIYRSLHCSARPYQDYNKSLIRVEHNSVKRLEKQLNSMDLLVETVTPFGSLTEIFRTKPGISRPERYKRRICTPEDLKVAQWLEENSTWRFDEDEFKEADAVWGDLCAPTIYMPRINIQALFIDDMGIEEAVYALDDYEEEVCGYLKARDENHMRLIEVLNQSPIDIINFGDNVHCATLSPSLFEEFVLPAYLQRTAKLHQAGKFVSAHWDGDTKALLSYAQQTGLDAIEAITPKPQGDVTLEEVKEALGDKIYLLDGVAAILFDPQYSEDYLLEQAEKVIRLFAPRLIMGISDEISYNGDIERVRIIGKLVEHYNQNL